jgi:hypothetical protein
METDGCYFRRRADEEFAAADKSECMHARASHFELAERYAQLAAAIDEANAKLGPLPGDFSPRLQPQR